jgi:hypothetical protein
MNNVHVHTDTHKLEHLICRAQTTCDQGAEEEKGGDCQQQHHNFCPHLEPNGEGGLILVPQLRKSMHERRQCFQFIGDNATVRDGQST